MASRILIVDDEPIILQVLHDVLAMAGFSSSGVDRADLVLDAARRTRPELFLIDIKLVRSSGIDVARTLRDSGFSQTPMIAMSASPTMVQVANESQLFDVCIEKPFDFDVFTGLVDHLLKSRLRAAVG
jgi:DNA-binding response OmpR family regulator